MSQEAYWTEPLDRLENYFYLVPFAPEFSTTVRMCWLMIVQWQMCVALMAARQEDDVGDL